MDLNSDPSFDQDSDSDLEPDPCLDVSVPGPGFVLVISDSEVRTVPPLSSVENTMKSRRLVLKQRCISQFAYL